ncbi:uncharacterized protein BJX67DRAFT_148660 [Aspergillus lucknowensis]|uniref:Uncharacterized protein n=1 Tax=Aspergillus lucknowensis TaxID=176173 RepID=A0ABR4LRY1_9EURO
MFYLGPYQRPVQSNDEPSLKTQGHTLCPSILLIPDAPKRPSRKQPSIYVGTLNPICRSVARGVR